MARGRPKVAIDWKQFEQQCALQCTLREIADYFNCSEDTIERHVREHYNSGFAETFKRRRQTGLISLRVNLFNLAKKDGRVAVFLAKNWLGMADKQETTITGDAAKPIAIIGVDDATKRLIKEVVDGKGTDATANHPDIQG